MTSCLHDSVARLLLLITAACCGETIDPAGLPEFFERCLKRGVNAGRNEQALRQLRQDAQVFVRSVFFGGK